MAVGFVSRYFKPAYQKLTPEEKKAQAEALWRDYSQTRQGIMAYDEHLYRIRSWNIALVGLLMTGYLGINLSGGKIGPGVFVAAMTAVTFGFWTLDALNKSLQMVHIYNSRDVEQLLRGEAQVYLGPTVSLRFQKKQGNHFKPILKNLMEGSLWPFYLPPLFAAIAVVSAKDFFAHETCQQFGCKFSPDAYVAAFGVAVVIGVVMISKFAQSNKLRHELLSWWPSHKTRKFKAKIDKLSGGLTKQEYKKLILEGTLTKVVGGLKTDIVCNHRLGPYKMNLYWENEKSCGIIFMNSPARQSNREYCLIRRRVCRDTFDSVRIYPIPFKTDHIRLLAFVLVAISVTILVPMMIMSWAITRWDSSISGPPTGPTPVVAAEAFTPN